jgi:L-ascorbate metabolism protein UlaG (beta-lactamase superfamily)
MKKILILYFIFHFSFFIYSCSAIKATTNAIGGSISSLFKSPRKIPDRITDPYRPDARLSVLWVGHATTLIQIDDKMILTDPVFTTTVGQFSKRLVEPGIDPEDLPDLDAVIISHMHIEHLSPASLDMFETKIHNLLIPQGGLVYIPNYDFGINELQTWQTWENDGLKITAVPVSHNGWRYGIDGAWMKTSYTGYIIEYNDIKVYFGGDTGYDSTYFHETSKRFPGIDLALLPIAPIHPREYSWNRHTDPSAAIKISRELEADRLMPMHFDTFPESLDTLGEATATLRYEMEKNNLSSDQVVILDIGERKVFIYRKEEKADL